MSKPAAEEQRRPIPSWSTIWQAVQVGLYTAIMTFLAGEVANGLGVNLDGVARAGVNAGIAAMLGFLGWTAAGAINGPHGQKKDGP